MNAVEVNLKEFTKTTFKPKKYDHQKAEKALKEARRILKAYDDKHVRFSLVDELIATRRAEAARE